jgi:hypothetical protein
LQPYSYIIHKPDYYSFITEAEAEYACYFQPFDSLFSDFPKIASKVYGFSLVLLEKPVKAMGLDKRIAATVVTILKDFLNRKVNIVIYICDNSDNREKARYHKFTHWFRKYDDGSIIQIRGVIRVGKTNILNAMLIHTDNKFKNDFIEAYEILTGIFTKPDDDELQNILNDDGW